MGVLEAIARPISRARIEGMGIAVEAVVRRNSVEYTALSDGFIGGVFGQFGSIAVRNKRIECGWDSGSPSAFEMTTSEESEFLELVESGDYAGAYVFLLDSLAFGIERERINCALPELDAEQMLTTLNILRSSLRDANVVEAPSDTLRRIAFPAANLA